MVTSNIIYVGQAPFLRSSIAGIDLKPACQEMLEQANTFADDANLLMNLSTGLFYLEQHELGLVMQAEALNLQRVYYLSAAQQPAKLRLLVLVVPGDVSANAPIDCLLENGDIDLIYYYCSEQTPLATPIPEHDVLMVAITESDENRNTLLLLEQALQDWLRPVINKPKNILTVERCTSAILSQHIPNLLVADTQRITRAELVNIAKGEQVLTEFIQGCEFPIILRPVGSHGGHDLKKIASVEDVALYLEQVNAEQFYLSPFVDYSSADGQFRKYRVVLVDGKAFACHMAISSDWMIHYVNAGMYEEPQKRAEEAEFMANFDDFAKRHQQALAAIYQRTGLDYLGIDCAETIDGRLLIFEIDHAMIVHAMDSEELFPHKQIYIKKIQQFFRNYCLRLMAARLGDK